MKSEQTQVFSLKVDNQRCSNYSKI